MNARSASTVKGLSRTVNVPASMMGFRMRTTSAASSGRASRTLGSTDSDHVVAGDPPDRGHSREPHRESELLLQNIEDRFDPGLPKGGESPEVGPSDRDGIRSQSERFEDVGAAPESAVDEDRDASAHGLHHLGERFDGAAGALLPSPAVVRDDDSVGAAFDGELRILAGHDALEEDLHARHAPEAVDEIPCEGGSVEISKTAGIEPVEHRLAAYAEVGRSVLLVAGGAVPLVEPRELGSGLAVADDGKVNCQGHR